MLSNLRPICFLLFYLRSFTLFRLRSFSCRSIPGWAYLHAASCSPLQATEIETVDQYIGLKPDWVEGPIASFVGAGDEGVDILPGDVEVVMSIAPDPCWAREASVLVYTAKISLSEVASLCLCAFSFTRCILAYPSSGMHHISVSCVTSLTLVSSCLPSGLFAPLAVTSIDACCLPNFNLWLLHACGYLPHYVASCLQLPVLSSTYSSPLDAGALRYSPRDPLLRRENTFNSGDSSGLTWLHKDMARLIAA